MYKTLLITFLAVSCSTINPDSKTYYEQAKSKHGLKIADPSVYRPTIKIKSNPALIAKGKEIYQKDCMQCHGKNGEGDGPQAKKDGLTPTNLRLAINETEHFAFYTRYSYWDGRMPGWNREFSDHELDAITAYLYQFKE